MSARDLLAGVFLGAGIVLVIASLILANYSSRISAEEWNKTLASYTRLLDEAEKLLREVNNTNIAAAYTEIVRQLPGIEKTLQDYQALYNEAEKHRELLIHAYELTHSRDYNETIKRLEELARQNNTLLSLLLGPVLEKLADYMKQAQPLTAEAMKILEAIEQNPPQKLRNYLETAKKIIDAMPPERLNQTLAEANKLLEQAKQALHSNATSRIQEAKQCLREYAEASLIAGSGLLVAAAILIATRGKRRKQ